MTRAEIEAWLAWPDHADLARAALDYLDKWKAAERDRDDWQSTVDTAGGMIEELEEKFVAAKKVANAERERCAEIAYNNYSWDEIASGIRALPPPFPEEGEKG